MSNGPFLLLYQDALEHCRQFVELRGVSQKNAGQFHSLLRRCVQNAYREIMGRRTWRYNMRLGQIATVEPYSTGTVVYDHTGGTYERELTLSDGTWPEWATYGVIRIGSVNYKVEDRKSSTVIVLDTLVNPGADVASTSYTLFRDSYTLPHDFLKMGQPQTENYWCAEYIAPDDFLLLQRQGYSTGEPSRYTIMRDLNLHGSLAVFLWPAPSSAHSWQFVYNSRGREMKYSGYDEGFSKGTISTTADSQTVTGVGTNFTADMVGAILRIGDNKQDRPTGIDGAHPRVDERTIVAVGSATSLTVDAGVNSTNSDVKYTISDVVDIEAGMANLLLRCCEKHVAITFGLEHRRAILEEYESAYILAGEEDSRILQNRSPGTALPSWHPFTVSVE